MRCAYSWAARPAANDCQAKVGLAVTGRRGGDIACAVAAPDAVRLLIGDVMGHDRRAARTEDHGGDLFPEARRIAEPVLRHQRRLFTADQANRIRHEPDDLILRIGQQTAS